MSIAEKLITVAENDQIITEAVATEADLIAEIKSMVDNLPEAGGGDSYYDTFWDAYQQNGNLTNYYGAFYGAGWTDETFKPKYTPMPGGGEMFHNSGITKLENGIVDFSKLGDGYMVFRGCPNLVRLPRLDFSSMTMSSWLFGQCPKLEEIECIVVNETLTSNTNLFWGCSALKEVRFEGVIGQAMTLQWSNLLSNDSVQSIIDHLKDLTGATAQTLTLHADVGAKLTQTQKDAIAAKNWNVTY